MELLSPSDWHIRFCQQASWTQDLRRYLYEHAGLNRTLRVLEIGCGTAALLPELQSRTNTNPAGSVYGLDLSPEFLNLAARHAPQARFILGDAHFLPFRAACFDMTLCHFLLMWVTDPTKVVSEMARVTHPGGAVLALAEPDYGGRIDFPYELVQLGEWQQEALRRQGANPQMGRRLAGIFAETGLKNVESGVIGGRWSGLPSHEEWESEWMMLQSDLEHIVSEKKLHQLRTLDQAAWERRERVLFVPTFYAWGRVSNQPVQDVS